MESIAAQIKEKESRLAEIGSSIEHFSSVLPKLKTERKEAADQKRKLDEELRTLQRTISKKKEDLNAKKSTIKHFYSDQQFSKTISNLQRLLERNSFPLSEEKKYVQEINALNRSKKQMTEFSVMNDEVQKLLENKSNLRERVDKCYRSVSRMTSEIKDQERKIDALHSEKDALKKDLDKLFYERHLTEQSRRRPAPEPSADRPARTERNHGNQIERRHSERYPSDKALSAGGRSMSESVFSHAPDFDRKSKPKKRASQLSVDQSKKSEPPYQSELLLCDTLIKYLQSKLPADMDALSISPNTTLTEDLPLTTFEADEGMYVLPKKRSDERRVVVRRSSSKKSKKDRQKMKMVHNMETLGQFSTVLINPPTTLLDIPAALDQLTERKRFYEKALAGEGLESEGNSPCSTGTLEDFLQRDNLDSPGDTLDEGVLQEEPAEEPPDCQSEPPRVYFEPPDADDETESGICCSTSESTAACSRSNSNSDCEPKDTQEFNSMIIGELKRVNETAQDDVVLDNNSNVDIEKIDPEHDDIALNNQ